MKIILIALKEIFNSNDASEVLVVSSTVGLMGTLTITAGSFIAGGISDIFIRTLIVSILLWAMPVVYVIYKAKNEVKK